MRPISDSTKVFVTSDGRYLGGKMDAEGWVTASTRDLGGVFTLAYDDQQPHVMPVDRAKWKENETIYFEVKDTLSGIEKVEGFIDGQFVLFEPVPHTPKYVCRLKKTPVKKNNNPRSLTFVAWDRRQNRQQITETINY